MDSFSQSLSTVASCVAIQKDIMTTGFVFASLILSLCPKLLIPADLLKLHCPADGFLARCSQVRCAQMKESDARESEMSTLAREFCAFMVRASGLQSKLEAFMEEKCQNFKGGSLLEEQKLEWTLLHKEYLDLQSEKWRSFFERRIQELNM